MGELPLLAYEELLERVGGEDDFAKELLQDFGGSLAKDLAGLKTSLEEGNLEEIVPKAHTLKGSSANLSAKAFSEAAKEIELAARNGDVEAARNGFGALERESTRLKEQIDDLTSA